MVFEKIFTLDKKYDYMYLLNSKYFVPLHSQFRNRIAREGSHSRD